MCDIPLIYVDTTHVYEFKELENHLRKFRWETEMESVNA